MRKPEDTGYLLSIDENGNLQVSQGEEYSHNCIFIENWQVDSFINYIKNLKIEFLEKKTPVEVEVF